MKQSLVTLSVIVVGLLIYIFTSTGKVGGEDRYGRQKREIDSLRAKIAILTKQRNDQDSLINKHLKTIGLLDKQIDKKNKEIVDIRKYYGDKIKSINTLTSDELNSFFSERYK